MNIKIVEAKNEDYVGFLNVFKETEEYHRISAPWKFVKPEKELFPKDYFQEIIQRNDAAFFLAKENNETVGYVIVFKEFSPNRPALRSRVYAYIDELGVRSDYQKKGVGKMLMKKVEDWAMKNDIDEVELSVWVFNSGAIEFYQKMGFKKITHRMRKKLDS